MGPVEDRILVVVVGIAFELELVVDIELVQFDILEVVEPNLLVDGSNWGRKMRLWVAQPMVQEWQFELGFVDMGSGFLGKLGQRIELVGHVVEVECSKVVVAVVVGFEPVAETVVAAGIAVDVVVVVEAAPVVSEPVDLPRLRSVECSLIE